MGRTAARSRRHRAAATQLAEPLADDLRCVPPRPQRRAHARRVEALSHRARRVSPGARRARRRRFPRGARTRARPARAAWRVHAIALPARIALSPPAGGRVPGHQRRAVAAGLAPGAVVARRPRHGAGSAARAHDLRRRRPQAVDLRVPRRRRARAGAGGRCRSGNCVRTSGDVSRAIRQSFRAVPPLLSFTNDLCDGRRQAPRSRRRVHATRSATSSRSREAASIEVRAARPDRRADSIRRPGRAWPTRSRVC